MWNVMNCIPANVQMYVCMSVYGLSCHYVLYFCMYELYIDRVALFKHP